MSAQPQPRPAGHPTTDLASRTGVTLRVDFATGRILGVVDPQDLRLRRPERTREADTSDLPRRQAQ